LEPPIPGQIYFFAPHAEENTDPKFPWIGMIEEVWMKVKWFHFKDEVLGPQAKGSKELFLAAKPSEHLQSTNSRAGLARVVIGGKPDCDHDYFCIDVWDEQRRTRVKNKALGFYTAHDDNKKPSEESHQKKPRNRRAAAQWTEVNNSENNLSLLLPEDPVLKNVKLAEVGIIEDCITDLLFDKVSSSPSSHL
jgi:hypothetical protein